MIKEKNSLPIGVFDSGVGGISVLRSLVELMPNEDYLFFGDSKNAPYGTKSVVQVQQLSMDIVDRFVDQGVKAVVVACNTATSAAITRIRAKYPDLIVVGLEPAVKPAVAHKRNGRIVVMATPLTLREPKFNQMADKYRLEAKQIIKVPAPNLVEFVERGELDSPALYHYLEKILLPYQEVDAVVLGCTHFPFVAPAIRDVVGQDTFIIDGGPGAAHQLQRRLHQKGLQQVNSWRKGQVTFANSNPDPREIELSERLFKS